MPGFQFVKGFRVCFTTIWVIHIYIFVLSALGLLLCVAAPVWQGGEGFAVLCVRLCVRFTPVEYVVNASMEELKKLAARIIPDAFPLLGEGAAPVTVRALNSTMDHRMS